MYIFDIYSHLLIYTYTYKIKLKRLQENNREKVLFVYVSNWWCPVIRKTYQLKYLDLHPAPSAANMFSIPEHVLPTMSYEGMDSAQNLTESCNGYIIYHLK